MNIRPPAVAGRFYPHSAVDLKQQVLECLASDGTSPDDICALIVPHAGYVFSGKVAGKAFQQIKQQASRIKRVILVGPSHRVAIDGCAVPSHTHFATPLGNVEIDQQNIQTLLECSTTFVDDDAHKYEHSLEVQLPFLQVCLKDVKVTPILTGRISSQSLAAMIKTIWSPNETLLIISSDLSHFHSYQESIKLDEETCQEIEAYRPSLTPHQACGSTGINSLLIIAKQRGYQLHRLALINSGDTTAGDKQRVVGYVSYLFHE
ncbi:AmmeMemoRadiSam system protein B [Thaumasiovibrio sp. DFM-14]|uniref:AmmeMemoRadiSam system protein B n=1 Tax=Thaumasiovibrio sp. DFM-14 TaxID=3384792 RepID=UPI0039A07C42